MFQIPHRLPGLWLSDPVYGPGDQGHSGVPGSEVERSEDFRTKRLHRYYCTSWPCSYAFRILLWHQSVLNLGFWMCGAKGALNLAEIEQFSGCKHIRSVFHSCHFSSFRRSEQVCQIPAILHEVLLLVSGEVYQVPEQKCLHHGEFHSHTRGVTPAWVFKHLIVWCLSPDCSLRKKFLSLSSRCLFPPHEEHSEVGFHYINTNLIPSAFHYIICWTKFPCCVHFITGWPF